MLQIIQDMGKFINIFLSIKLLATSLPNYLLSPYPNIIDIDVTIAKLLIIIMIRPNIFRIKSDKYLFYFLKNSSDDILSD